MAYELGEMTEYRPYKSAVTAYVSGDISEESKDIIQHFGADAPARLNRLSCAMEDAVIELHRKLERTREELAIAKSDLDALQDKYDECTDKPAEEHSPADDSWDCS